MWLGIDFGASYSSATVVVNNNLYSIPDSKKNSYLFPSSVFIGEKGAILVGREAEREGKKDPLRYCHYFKPNRESNGTYQLGDKTYQSEQLITYLFTKIKQEAEDFLIKIELENSLYSIGIGIPATYGETQKKIIEEAAKAAGFTEIALKEESVAAAIYWESRYQIESKDILLVYDLGASSFKANLIEKQEGAYKILGEALELENCAGREFERLIYQDLKESDRVELADILDFQRENIQGARAHLIFKDWVEEIKKQLKETEEIEELIPGSFSQFYHLSRSKFNHIIEPYLKKTISGCEQLIEKNLKNHQKIKGILLVGGSCHIPYVSEMIAKHLQLPILLDSEPELAVSRGMALYGASLNAKKKAESYFSQGDDLPIESITWEDANEFCQRLSRKTGLKYRLPSEAEWEYACRAGTKTPFHFGKTITSNLANYNGSYTYAREPKGEAREQTTKVGSFPPNAYGLYDMHGGVWEWCADSWHDNYHSAPSDGSIWLNCDSSRPHLPLLRGGFWNSSPHNCRSASRLLFSPECNFDRCGFRIVCTVENNL